MIVKDNGIIKQYSLVVYPVDYVVAIGEVEEEVNTLYRPYEEEYKDAHIVPPKTTGSTYRVIERETGIPCIMIWIGKINECTTSIVGHECGHALLELWAYINSEVSLTNQEPFCYLLGNLIRLAVGTFYELPGVEPPKVPGSKQSVATEDVFNNPTRSMAKSYKTKHSSSKDEKKTKKVAILDYSTCTIHLYDAKMGANIDEVYLATLGYKNSSCYYMVGEDIPIHQHDEILKPI